MVMKCQVLTPQAKMNKQKLGHLKCNFGFLYVDNL